MSERNTVYRHILLAVLLCVWLQLSLVVKMEIVDQSSGILVCVVMPVQIQSARRRKIDQILRFVRMH